MGMEIQIDTLEDMCSLMCDNVIPERKDDRENGEGMDMSTQADTGLRHMDR